MHFNRITLFDWTRGVPALAGLALLAGCSTQRNPIRTSLIDLTGESRSVSVYSHWFNPFPIAVHRQATSIGGLLHMPDIGQEFQFSGGNDVTTAVGIAVVQSYRLIGEADTPGSDADPTKSWDQVRVVRDALERVQAYALDASVLTAETVDLRKQIAEKGIASLESELKNKEASRTAKEQDLERAKQELRVAANQPGIVIARWDATGSAGGSLRFGAAINAGALGSESRAGFVILGGLRLVTLVFGEDFWWLLNNLRPHEKKHIEDIGITTHLLQARDVVYVSDLSVQRSASIVLDIQRLGGTAIDEAKLLGYWSFVGQYANSGNLGRITWKREPFCAVCSTDLPGLAKPEERMLQQYFCLHEKDVDPASFQGWRTVAATVTYLRNVPFVFSWKNHAAKYAEARKMYSSPSCPFCRHQKCPAIVPGRDLSKEKSDAGAP